MDQITAPDAQLLDIWLAEHGDALFAYASARVREPAMVEDLIQDTLLAPWQAQAGYRGGAAVRTWLIGILKHKIVDQLRRGARETNFGDDDIDPLDGRMDGNGHWQIAPVEFRDPRAILENAQLREAMLRCIDALPARLRMVFLLKEFDDPDSAELIAAAGLSGPNNLWVTLSRARERVRSCLEQKWGRGA